jgi:hypothetical protein
MLSLNSLLNIFSLLIRLNLCYEYLLFGDEINTIIDFTGGDL